MNRLVRSLAIGLITLPFATATQAETLQEANFLENIVALQVAQDVCGYTINHDMLGIVMTELDIQAEDLGPGGRHWASVQQNQSRVRQLISSNSGKSSFCRNVKNDLSAMFD